MKPYRWAIAVLALLVAFGAEARSRTHARVRGTPPMPAANQDAAPADSDFEQRAAELREWLREREEQRRLEGDIGTGIPETYVSPLGHIVREHKAKSERGHGPGPEPAVNGRQRHVLDPNQPIILRGTRHTIPFKQPAPNGKGSATHKKAR